MNKRESETRSVQKGRGIDSYPSAGKVFMSVTFYSLKQWEVVSNLIEKGNPWERVKLDQNLTTSIWVSLSNSKEWKAYLVDMYGNVTRERNGKVRP